MKKRNKASRVIYVVVSIAIATISIAFFASCKSESDVTTFSKEIEDISKIPIIELGDFGSLLVINTDEEVTKPEKIEEEIEDDGLPHDRLFITVERQRYEDGDLTLIIPKLQKNLYIYNGVTDDVLKKGAGLYDYSQLPGKGNRNVSIAGHRNTVIGGVISDAAPFYYVDQLKEGDYLYLTDAGNIYRYLYEDTKVVEPDNWGPIYSQGFSCLTITTCEPIGPGTHRMIVRGRLDEIFPFTDDFEYLEQAEM